MQYTKAQLDAMPAAELLNLLDEDIEIDDFNKAAWKSVWVQAVEYWYEDGSAWYGYVINGFKGWVDRSPFEIYADLRFTYIDGQDVSWDELADENNELGKYS